jgi:hypothetical protein
MWNVAIAEKNVTKSLLKAMVKISVVKAAVWSMKYCWKMT